MAGWGSAERRSKSLPASLRKRIFCSLLRLSFSASADFSSNAPQAKKSCEEMESKSRTNPVVVTRSFSGHSAKSTPGCAFWNAAKASRAETTIASNKRNAFDLAFSLRIYGESTGPRTKSSRILATIWAASAIWSFTLEQICWTALSLSSCFSQRNKFKKM